MEREVPQSYEEALRVLEGSAHASVCKDAYREWRALGADVKAALIRAKWPRRSATSG